MSEMAAMLEAIYRAPRLNTFHGIGSLHSDPAAVVAWMQESRRKASELNALTILGTGHIVSREGSGTVSIGGSSSSKEVRTEVWLDLLIAPSRWRVDQASQVQIATSDDVALWTERGGTLLPREHETTRLPAGWERTLCGAFLLGHLELQEPDIGVVADRPCWHSRGTRSLGALHYVPMMRPTIPGDEVEIWVDRESGVLLGWVGRHEERELERFQFDEVAVDEAIPDGAFDFAPPDGSEPVSYEESRKQHLETMGLDPDSSDEELRDQFRGARGRAFGSMATTEDPDVRARSFTPTGPPPTDEQDALIDVGMIFEHLNESSEDGEDLINVEYGEGLAPILAKTSARYPEVTFRVDHIKFLNDAEAMVWFTVDIGLMQVPFEGRAVHGDSRWRVSRSTLADLLARAGTAIPPPE